MAYYLKNMIGTVFLKKIIPLHLANKSTRDDREHNQNYRNTRDKGGDQETRFLKPLKETALEISRTLGSEKMASAMAMTL